MDKKKLAVVFITHKRLNPEEVKFLSISSKYIHNYKKFLITPNSINIQDQFFDFENIKFENKYFETINGYNQLLMNTEFYLNFSSYEYILIMQPDCVILKDGLDSFCNQINYLGASFVKPKYVNFLWISNFPRLGHLLSKFKIGLKLYGFNGGLSIRNVQFFIENAPNLKTKSKLLLYREDIIFSYLNFKKEKYNRKISDIFCLEEKLKYFKNLNDVNSFCLHDPRKYNINIFKELIND